MFTPITEYTQENSPWKFNVKDLDQAPYIARAKAEAQEIYDNPKTRKGRTLKKVIQTVLIGHAAEYYAIQFKKFTDDPRKCKDVVEPTGIPVEFKATSCLEYVYFVLKRANEKANDPKYGHEYSRKLAIFVHDEKLNYFLQGIYIQSNKNMI